MSVLSYEAADGVATLTLDDGKANALSPATLQELHAAFDRAEQEGAAVVLAGRPGMFSAGFDLKVFQSGGEEVVRMLELGVRLMHRMFSFPRPVVLAATGHALAAGAFLLLSADRRVGAGGDFKLGLNETTIGMTLPWPTLELARYRLDPQGVDEAVVNARIYSPAEAVEVGYLDEVADDPVAAAQQEAARLGALNEQAFAGNKLRLREPQIAALEAAIDRMLAEFRELLAGGGE